MKTMALSREITLTIDNYNITLDKEIKIYEYDAINLCFTIQEYGIVMRDGKAHNRVMPVVALKAYMLIETPQGTDSVEATNIVRNKVIFSLGNKYSQFVGVGKMQIILKDLDGCRITLPEFAYEVKQSINTGWETPDVLIGEKDFVVTDELGRPVETTKISEMDEVNEITPQTYTMVINEDGNKKIKFDTIMESVNETIEFNVEEIDRKIDEMIEVYDDEEVEVEFPSLHNDVERIKGEINEISESLDAKTNLNNNKVVIENTEDDTSPALNVYNKNMQGTFPLGGTNAGIVLHNYTDAPAMQIDNVGVNSALVINLANNPTNRPDKEPDFCGNGNFISTYQTYFDGNEKRTKTPFRINNSAELVYSDGYNSYIRIKSEDDNVNPCFTMLCENAHKNTFSLMNSSQRYYNHTNNTQDYSYNYNSTRHNIFNFNNTGQVVFNNNVTTGYSYVINGNSSDGTIFKILNYYEDY